MVAVEIMDRTVSIPANLPVLEEYQHLAAVAVVLQLVLLAVRAVQLCRDLVDFQGAMEPYFSLHLIRLGLFLVDLVVVVEVPVAQVRLDWRIHRAELVAQAALAWHGL